MLKQLAISCLIVLVAFATASAKQDKTLPKIKQLTDVKPEAGVFDVAGRGKPLVIGSAEEAAKHFAGDDLVKLKKQVDFKKQVVLVFAWQGSGQDRLETVVGKAFPKQVFFRHKPGRTRDLRRHVNVYVLRSNVKWKVR